MRAPEVTGYIDFAGGETTTAEQTLTRLDGLSKELPKIDLVFKTTKILHEGIAHINPHDVRAYGLEHYGMTVPITENWILFLLKYVKPDTYLDYEFCSYRKVVERGTGRCGQQALAAVSFLQSRGVNTGFVALGGHAIATAEVKMGVWHLLDPDFGGVIPYDIKVAEADPAGTLSYYWSDAAQDRRLDLAYASDNEVRFGGVEARFGRACRIEYLSYLFKWLIPIGLAVFTVGLFYIKPKRAA